MTIARILVVGVLCGCAVGCKATCPANDAAPSDRPAGEPSNAGPTAAKVDPNALVEVQETKWPNGNLKSRTEGKKDEGGNFLQHGTTTIWYENGQKKSEQQFVDGVPHGPRNTWYVEGRNWTEG